MVSKFGTSFSNSTGSIDLTSFAMKTDLGAITVKQADILNKINIVQKSPGPKGERGLKGEKGDRGLVNMRMLTGTYSMNERQTVLRFPDGKSLDNGKIIILGVYIRQDGAWITLDSQTHIRLVWDFEGMHLERARTTILNGRVTALRLYTIPSDSVSNVNYLVQYSIMD